MITVSVNNQVLSVEDKLYGSENGGESAHCCRGDVRGGRRKLNLAVSKGRHASLESPWPFFSGFVLTSPKRHPAGKSFPIPEGKWVISHHHCILFTLLFALTHGGLHTHVVVSMSQGTEFAVG